MKNKTSHINLYFLIVAVLGISFGTTASSMQFVAFASTSNEGGDGNGNDSGGDGGGGNDNNNEDGDDSGNGGSNGDDSNEDGGDGNDDTEPEPTPPQPQPQPPIEAPPAPSLPAPINPELPEPEEPITCPDGTIVYSENDCPEPPPTPIKICQDGTQIPATETCPLPPLPTDPRVPGLKTPEKDLLPPAELPLCDGSAQECITPNGDICLIGQGGHECECAEDMSDCPKHPSLIEPPVPPQPPIPDPTPPDEQCLFDPTLPQCATNPNLPRNGCPEGFNRNEDDQCVPEHPNGCPEGYHSHEDDETGKCIPDEVPCEPGYIRDPDFPTCNDKDRVCEENPELEECKPVEPPVPCDPNTDPNCNPPCKPCEAGPGEACPAVCIPYPTPCKDEYELIDGKCEPIPPECPPGWEYRKNQDDCYKEITIIINKIIKETNEGKHDDGFPDVDIIGLSVKQSGDAMICAMDIDNGWVQCQEFGMDPNKVNSDFWRIIETDHDKDYDNGNTGSNNVDLAIQDIKNQDFDELDDDRDNHDFGIDIGWIAIDPEGNGVTCLTTERSGEQESLCEPFKVSAQDVDGQITEGVQFTY
ncbi:MAG: hypothetical protein ACRD8W_06405 [Nitrososphaeraceae archaeon]